MTTILKNTVLGLATALLLSACTGDQEKVETPAKTEASTKSVNKAGASDATTEELHKQSIHAAYAKKNKKKRRLKQKNKKVNKPVKFCFKDNRSIHYKAQQRCK